MRRMTTIGLAALLAAGSAGVGILGTSVYHKTREEERLLEEKVGLLEEKIEIEQEKIEESLSGYVVKAHTHGILNLESGKVDSAIEVYLELVETITGISEKSLSDKGVKLRHSALEMTYVGLAGSYEAKKDTENAAIYKEKLKDLTGKSYEEYRNSPIMNNN